jgi:hypothetical protein
VQSFGFFRSRATCDQFHGNCARTEIDPAAPWGHGESVPKDGAFGAQKKALPLQTGEPVRSKQAVGACIAHEVLQGMGSMSCNIFYSRLKK